jgi:hypothetical protein
MKVTTIVLAAGMALASTFALAQDAGGGGGGSGGSGADGAGGVSA